MMKKLALILLLTMPYLLMAQLTNPQSKRITKKFFPDPEIEINTPAFQKKKGFTKYDDMVKFLEDVVRQHPSMTKLEYIGKSQKGRAIPMITLEKKDSDHQKIRVWMQGGLHGNEPASTEGLFHLINQLLDNDAYATLLDRITLAIVPMANIDGYQIQDRYAANGLDLNRDQTKLLAPETVLLKQAYSNFNPQVAVDFHEYRPYRRDFARLGTFGITSLYDVMFLYSGNLNVPENLREFTESLFIQNARETLDEHSILYRDYISTRDYHGEIHFSQGSFNARSSATSWALTNTISSLIEVRGVGIGRSAFKRRTFSTFLVALSFLESSYSNTQAILQQLQQASKTLGPAVVKSKPAFYPDTIRFIDLDTRKAIDLGVTIQDALSASAKLTRARPIAYIIPGGQETLLSKLRTLGLELEAIPPGHPMKIESYLVTTYFKDAQKYEGVYRQEVTTKLKVQERSFDIPVYMVKMDQPRANLAIELLEPEAPNSFVSFDIIPTKAGDELPVYRLIEPLSFKLDK